MIFQVSHAYEKSVDTQTDHRRPRVVDLRDVTWTFRCYVYPTHVGSAKITLSIGDSLQFSLSRMSQSRLSTHTISVSFHSWTSSVFSVLSGVSLVIIVKSKSHV